MSRWQSAWVLLWCSTFLSCSVFCERHLALLQTSQSRHVYLWKCPPFAVNALEELFCILVSILTAKIVNMWTQKLLECKKKKKKKKQHSSGCLRDKTFGMLIKSTDSALTSSWNNLFSWGLTVGFIFPPPLTISVECVYSHIGLKERWKREEKVFLKDSTAFVAKSNYILKILKLFSLKSSDLFVLHNGGFWGEKRQRHFFPHLWWLPCIS